MKNKVHVIDGAIDQCKRLMNNETIILKGLHELHITRGKASDDDLRRRINQLQMEKSNLKERIARME